MKIATTNKTLVGTDGNSYMVTSGNKVKKVNSLGDIKKLDVDLQEDYSKMNLNLYRYFKDQDENTTWRKTFVLYRMYQISYNASGLKIVDSKNYGKVLEHKLEPFPAPIEVYLYISKLGVNKQILKENKMKKLEVIPVNHVLQEVNTLLKSTSEVSARVVKPLYEKFLSDETISESLKNQISKNMERKFPYLVTQVEKPKVEAVVEEVVDLNDLRKKLIAKLSRCTVGETAVKIIKEAALPHRGYTVLMNKLIRAFEDNSLTVHKFRDGVFELLRDDTVFQPKLKPAPKFVERPQIIIDELISIENNIVTYRRKHSEYKVSVLEFYATEILFAEPETNVAIAKLITGDITCDYFLEDQFIKDKTVSLNYFDLKKVPAEREKEITDALEDVMMQWYMKNPLNYVYKNQVHYEKGSKVKIIFRDTNSYEIATVVKVDGGYQVRLEDGTITHLLKHQEVKVIK